MPVYEYPVGPVASGNINGVGAPGQVAFFTAAMTIGGDAGLTYDAATDKLTVAGSIDPLSILLSDPAAGTALFFESEDGQTAPVSGVATGRIRYNDATGTWQVSTQGAAYADLLTGVGAAFVDGGNSFGAVATLGTNDAFGLEIETSGVSKYRFETGGNLTMLGDFDFVPSVDDDGELGTDALRWTRIRGVTIVSGDFHLCDESRGAHWMLREEPDHISVVNVLTGKRYRMVVQAE